VAKTEPVVGGQNNTFVDEGLEAKDIETPAKDIKNENHNNFCSKFENLNSNSVS
jgi:hypothetical protein